MNRALLYLWLTLIKRRLLEFARGLRRPTTAIGVAAVATAFGCLFHYRDTEPFAQLVRRESLLGGGLLMLGGSLFLGFLQRGLVFDPPDLEFIFPGPFTRRQIVVYRLLPSYLYAVAQGVAFAALFAAHLDHPLLMTICLILFQAACFHISTGAAIFAGTISPEEHHRLKWLLVGLYAFVTAAHLRAAWGMKVVPGFLSAPSAQILFYPAVTLADLGSAPSVGPWLGGNLLINHQFWLAVRYLVVFAGGAAASLWLLLRLRADIFEASLATTTLAAEKRLRLREGRSLTVRREAQPRSVRLPTSRLFRGVGAVVWKNLVAAWRSKKQFGLAAAFTLVYLSLLAALRWVFQRAMSQGGEPPPGAQVADFGRILVLLLLALAFFLQRAFAFDFRRDGRHLVGFRTLPVSPLALALAEVAVPTGLCLAFQAVGILVVWPFAGCEWHWVVLTLLVYPAAALGLNGVWNLQYLLAAARRAGGRAESASPVTMVMVVALSFLVFLPAGWAAQTVSRRLSGPSVAAAVCERCASGGADVSPQLGVPLAATLGLASALAVQYLVDFLLLLTIARLFQYYEVSRDAQ